MKNKIVNFIFILVFVAGLSLVLYPHISNALNNYKQSKVIDNHEAVIEEKQDFAEEWVLARAFNDSIVYNALYEEAFGSESTNMKETEYWKVLNIDGDGVMGYLEIPNIKVKLAIYHGTGEKVLQTGIGHINGTKLPIGGESTHCVLSAHRGLPKAKLFTDIDQLEIGDMFYIHVLDKTLTYQVDQILDMVKRDDVETLENAFSIEEGKDQVTLFTCTPYGINSHRLLVRGSRVPYSDEI